MYLHVRVKSDQIVTIGANAIQYLHVKYARVMDHSDVGIA